MLFDIPEILVGAVMGGAIIYLCPGLGAAGNAWFKRVKAFFKSFMADNATTKR